MSQAVTGAIAMGFGIAGLFFLRFWHETRDRLFLFFALAFFILAASRIGVAFTAPGTTPGEYLYWIRLAGFATILLAILDKNWNRKRSNN